MKFENHLFYNCRVYLDDGTSFVMDANWLHNNNLDQWKDWNCYAGKDRLYIDPTGKIFGAECENDFIGHIDQDWELFEQPTVCKRTRCSGCADDLMVEKNVV